MTNAPHLTVVAAAGIDASIVSRARAAVGPLLPARLGLGGLVLFGQGPRVTIAHLAEPDPTLADAVAGLRALVPAARHPVWTPHVTVARRVPRRLLPAALEVLQATAAPRELVCDRLRWWDPDQDVIEDIAVARDG